MKRDLYYDYVRGVAILLVVLGHSIQNQDPDFSANPLFLAIYLFHMPLFAYLSGLFFVRSYEHYTPWELIKRRFVQLMVPCLSWGLLSMAISIVGKIIRHKPMEVSFFIHVCINSLWYLSTIFGLIVIGVIVHSLVRRVTSGGGGYIIGWLVAFLALYFAPRFSCFSTVRLEFLCPFFALGIWTRNLPYSKINRYVALCAAVVYLAIYLNFSFEDTMYAMKGTESAAEHLYKTFLRIAGGVSGIVLTLYGVRHLMRLGAAKLSWLAALGTITLPIYAVHGYFYKVIGLTHCQWANLIVYLVLSAAVIGLSLVAYRVLLKSRVLAFLLFGKVRAAASV